MSDLGYGFIYITTNNINGKKYIGQRKYGKDIGTYLGSGILLNKAIRKYGRENFSKEIIDSANTLEELNELEIYYIKLYDAVESNEYYNIASGGKSANNYAGKSEEEMNEIRKKFSKRCGEKHPMYGKKFSEEVRNNMRKGHKDFSGKNHPSYGKKRSEETKEKIRNNRTALSGENHPNYKQRIPEMYEDVKNGMKRKEFLAKYGVGRKIWDSVKKSINDLTNSD